ncbi:MAG: energy transducer TonB [Candidatus Eisenbacteria bacterium]|nr:energy transducer TonB [Candidatus Eisenbacteria bacterium]
MQHGTEEYYLERARFVRRVSLSTLAVSVVFLALQLALLLPALRAPFSRALRAGPLNPKRFGFEGPEQYVRRIILEASGPAGRNPGRTTITFLSRQATKGGRRQAESSSDPHARPDPRRIRTGEGESAEELLARARILYGGSAPVMQSEDLIIERLVRPAYPEDARDQGIEGRIALVARVDTTGAVVQVDLMSSDGQRLLEQAATTAVWQCRFRPYRVAGKLEEVYAVFRFNFRID